MKHGVKNQMETRNYIPSKCSTCGKPIYPHWKYCQEHTRGNILLDMDTATKKKKVPLIRSVHDFGEGKCKMCGMELLPSKKIYKNIHTGREFEQILRPSEFCDMKCYAYFNRRLSADERGVPLKE